MQSSQQILSDNVQHLARLNRIANEVVSGQANNSLSTQSVPGPKPSILEHIHFHAKKFKIFRSDEQIDDHIDVSTHSIEMPFESTPSFHLNRIKEFEHEKPVEKVVKVHEVYKLDKDHRCLDKVIRNYLATHTPHVEPIESYCEDKCDNDELLLQKKFEDEFSKVL